MRIGDTELPTYKQNYEALVAKHKELLTLYDHEYSLESMEQEWFEAVEYLKSFTLIDSEGKRGLSERAAIDLLFKAHNEISRFYRDPTKTREHVKELEKWIETYHQTNLLMFPVDKAFTPYKAKLLLLPALLRTGNIHSLFEHLTEATENSGRPRTKP